MRLGDVLNVVGTNELSDFPWGPSVVSLVNGFASEEDQLTLSSTGVELNQTIDKVDEHHRQLLLQARITTGTIGLPEASANDDEIEEKHKNHSIVSIGFALILCLIAVILSLSGTSVTSPDGTTVDTSGIEAIMSMVLEAISHK